jgi:hypothetical protein
MGARIEAQFDADPPSYVCRTKLIDPAPNVLEDEPTVVARDACGDRWICQCRMPRP